AGVAGALPPPRGPPTHPRPPAGRPAPAPPPRPGRPAVGPDPGEMSMTTSLPSTPPGPAIAYDDLGSGAPIVLLHPSGFGPGVLHPFAHRLAAHRRVVIPHRRGFGASAQLPLPD